VHAAAGGTGLILCQWAAALGASVIGTGSTEAKAELTRAHGCSHTIAYSKEDFVADTEAAKAHRAREARVTSGSTILTV
jgi:NADPH2:quinone reductase